MNQLKLFHLITPDQMYMSNINRISNLCVLQHFLVMMLYSDIHDIKRSLLT